MKHIKISLLVLLAAFMPSLLSARPVPQQPQSGKIAFTISLKKPGNKAVSHTLRLSGNSLTANEKLPVSISYQEAVNGNDETVTITLRANKDTYFNIGATIATGMKDGKTEFYLPGFWYHRNMRSPETAPSFKTSRSWDFREDRLSTPLASAFNPAIGEGIAVIRLIDGKSCDVQTQNMEGEIILSGNTSVGYLGFDDSGNETKLTMGYPYIETPRRYIRKLTLAAPVYSFVKLKSGETKVLRWQIHRLHAKDYGEFVKDVWQYSFDTMQPQPLQHSLTAEEVKAHLCGFFRNSYVDKYPLKYNSGLTLRTDDCLPAPELQIGFCGRILLNAFNEIEYGDAHGDKQLSQIGRNIIASFLANGFSAKGYFHDFVNYRNTPAEISDLHSIRQQSEAAYAILHYLRYENNHGRKHKDWEAKIRQLLNNFVALQKEDGHFARKFNDDGSDVDASGGSTPSATSTLVMGYKYFGDKRYLAAAKRTIDYVEKEIISNSDYFSSTLDANCEDKEAAIAAVTSTYYLAMVTKGKEQQHYIDLCKQAAYFAMSWYYTWDVPFAPGQMLGDVNFHSRGWGNVSVENNHIDVFVFELPHIVKWLAGKTGEKRFSQMYDVIVFSLTQLMPTEEHHFGIAKPGFYPEVVQHTTWDYGRNGKGFYNDIFAPGWTVASLWELYSPQRTVDFLK